MFNNPNNQNASQGGSVDDIFAETDKVDSTASQADIETRQVGLASANGNLASLQSVDNNSVPPAQTDEMTKQMLSEEQPSPRSENKGYLKVIIIVLVVIALGAAAYFAYLNFFAGEEVEAPASIVGNTTNPPINNNGFVNVVPEEIVNAINNEVVEDGSAIEEASSSETELSPGTPLDIPGLNDEVVESDFQNFVDSDSDGLSDEEELLLGTNPNLIDTDNDGLNDYEEARIYFTDPLKPDTDGDGYLDGEEVRSGYDPKVVGAKLPGNTIE
jgi:hypothetical protein